MSSRLSASVNSGNATNMFANLLLVAVAFYGILWAGDFGVHTPEWTPAKLWLEPRHAEALYGLSEVMVGVLAVALTVISIILELAANRYTPKITEIFLRDRVNIFVLCSFVMTTVLVFWVNLTLSSGPEGYHPRAMLAVVELSVSICLLALLPYFAYVFEFLSPSRLVRHVARSAVHAMERVSRGGTTPKSSEEVIQAIDQLGDMALKSVQSHDKSIASESVFMLSDILNAYIGLKSRLPAEWFDMFETLKEDSDFVSFHRQVVLDLKPSQTWVEMKVLLQMLSVYLESLQSMREVAHLVAIQTRRLGVRAAEVGDGASVTLTIRFMNTYMRGAVNARDVRSAYNLLNEYQFFAKGLIGTPQQARIVELGEFIKTYGQVAFHAKLTFILETAAYDLCALLEDAYLAGAPEHEALLDIFLDVDREPEGEVQEAALRGVRKAQVKAAAFFLEQGNDALARRVFQDMCHEDRARMNSIRRELQETTSPEFWEISDRGTNFDYMPPSQRRHLVTFFGWFS